LCKTLIYPVPDPRYPFLGVHFTRGIDDKVECGPNAVLAFAREGYSKTKINPLEMLGYLSNTGVLKFFKANFRTGISEMKRSFSKRLFTESLQRLIPEVKESDLVPGSAGVRAQAIKNNGAIVDDFEIKRGRNSVHILNAPSPAATSSLSIGL